MLMTVLHFSLFIILQFSWSDYNLYMVMQKKCNIHTLLHTCFLVVFYV